MRHLFRASPIALAFAVVVVADSAVGARQGRDAERWVTAWGVSQNGVAADALTNTTVRMIIPRHNRPPVEGNTGWSDVKTLIRQEVNQWIRTKSPFDAVIDFDKVMQDPANRDLLQAPFNCGDGVHPSPRGYYEMGRSVRLDLFR